MRRIFLLLFLLVGFKSFAQIQGIAKFDFTEPTKLTPAITPKLENGDVIILSDEVFSNRGVEISFEKGSVPTGAQIQTNITDKKTSYCLRVTATTTMTFSGKENVTIDSIRISDFSIIGEIALKEGEPGFLDPLQQNKFWKNDSKTDLVSSVSFFNSNAPAKIDSLLVYYTEKSDVIVPKTNIDFTETLDEFIAVNLLFEDDVKSIDAEGIVLRRTDLEQSYPVSVVLSEDNAKIVSISVDELIAEDGEYELFIPARAIKQKNGYENSELSYKFTVYADRASFNPTVIDPEQGYFEATPETITLKFSDDATISDSKALILYKDGKATGIVSISQGEDKTAVVLTVDKVYTDLGEYRIRIPEKIFHNKFYNIIDEEDRWNKQVDLVYTVGEAPVGPDPEPEPEPEPEPDVDSATMILAKELVEMTGVGYPTTESETRVALQTLIDQEETPTDEQLEAAIEAFYKDSNVELPAEDEWYNIIGVNKAGESVYLAYNEGQVTLSTDEEDAAIFLVGEGTKEGTITFQTEDGKYLHVLSNSAAYAETSTSNVTEKYNSLVNDLTLAKLQVKEDFSDAFGKLSIFGSLGTNKYKSEVVSEYAMIDYSELAVCTGDAPLAFTETISGAFTFNKVTVLPVYEEDVEYSLAPNLITNETKKVKLTFTSDSEISLVGGESAFLTGKTVKEPLPVKIVETEETNVFDVVLPKLEVGEYVLNILVETFTLVVDEETYTLPAMEENIKVVLDTDDEFNFDIFNSYYCLNEASPVDPVQDVDLNDWVLYVYNDQYSAMIPNESKPVYLTRFMDNSAIAACGHFEKTKIDIPNTYAIKWVCDWHYDWKNPSVKVEGNITAGALKRDMYSFIVKKATYGDSNFGLWLDGVKFIDKVNAKGEKEQIELLPSMCKANPEFVLSYSVNYTPTSIDSIDEDENSELYDLSGRRVNDTRKPGLYIVNGKKIFVK